MTVSDSIIPAGGMRMFGIIMTCVGTWRMRGLNVAEKLQEVLVAG